MSAQGFLASRSAVECRSARTPRLSSSASMTRA